MPAATQVPALSGPVGMKPRLTKGPQTKNAKNDVALVQKLLKQSGQRVPVSGKMDDATIAAIKSFQKNQAGFKFPDGVIDPGKKTYKKLVDTALKKGKGELDAGEGGGKEQKYREFKYKGTTYTLTESDYDKAVTEVAGKLTRIVDALQSQHDTLVTITREMNNTIQGSEGLMQSICFVASAKWAGLDVPDFKNQSKSGVAIARARGALKKRDITAASKLLPEAKASVEAYDREMAKYRNKLIGGSEGVIASLEFTRDTSFTVAEYLGTAVLVAKSGGKINPKVANASSAAFFAMVKSGATDLGKYTASAKAQQDPAKFWRDAGERAVVDGLVATATSIIAGANFKKFGGAFASRLVAKPPFKQLGKKFTEDAVKKALDGGAQKIAKDGLGELMKSFGDMTKKGRVPNRKEVEKQITDYLFGQLSSKIFSKFELAHFKFVKDFEGKLQEGSREKLGSWFANLPKTKRAKILHDVLKKNEDALIKAGLGKTLDAVKASASENAIVKQSVQNALTDKKLMELLKKEMKKYEKKGV